MANLILMLYATKTDLPLFAWPRFFSFMESCVRNAKGNSEMQSSVLATTAFLPSHKGNWLNRSHRIKIVLKSNLMETVACYISVNLEKP